MPPSRDAVRDHDHDLVGVAPSAPYSEAIRAFEMGHFEGIMNSIQLNV